MYTVQQVFNSAMDLTNKKSINGVVDANSTAFYKARTVGILNMWQEELALELIKTLPVPLLVFTDNMTLNYISCASYYLAAHLLLQEDTDQSNFFEQKYQELKKIIIGKTQLATITPITDVYASEV